MVKKQKEPFRERGPVGSETVNSSAVGFMGKTLEGMAKANNPYWENNTEHVRLSCASRSEVINRNTKSCRDTLYNAY